jgi:hypothetical protein
MLLVLLVCGVPILFIVVLYLSVSVNVSAIAYVPLLYVAPMCLFVSDVRVTL